MQRSTTIGAINGCGARALDYCSLDATRSAGPGGGAGIVGGHGVRAAQRLFGDDRCEAVRCPDRIGPLREHPEDRQCAMRQGWVGYSHEFPFLCFEFPFAFNNFPFPLTRGFGRQDIDSE
jgi:hypothetical protein